MLDVNDKNMIKEYSSNKCFRFGDNKPVRANYTVRIPGYIGKEKVIIQSDVVKSDIPLLLSKAYMKELGMVIDLANDTVDWKRGRIEHLKATSTGHYAIPIYKFEGLKDDRNFVKNVLYSYGKSKAKDKASKLHKQFAHPRKEKLLRLIKDAGINDPELEEEIGKLEESCQTCFKYKRSPPRPVVSMPLAKNFNDVVSMDLKCWGNKYFLVMVDLATRFCNACVINNKSPSVIIDGIMRYWVAIFGTPRKILTDNGGEFNNNDFRSMGENFNIDIMCTAAESPWSNGVCERLNAVLKDNVLKIHEETKCNVDTALAWAVAARNAIHNNNGFSPNQLVFSFNPNHPNIAEDRPPALENCTSSQIVANNLNALHKCREEFVKSDANERMKRALSHNIRKTDDENVIIGNYVYYKREGDDRWRGPARVIGKDGKINILRHGGQIIRTHICRIKGIPDKCDIQENDMEDKVSENNSNMEKIVDIDSEDDDYVEKSQMEKIEISEDDKGKSESNTSEIERVDIPKVGKRYEVTLKDSNERKAVKILSRAGKATGKFKNCYNYRNEENGEETWMDFVNDINEIREISDEEEIMITCTKEKTMEVKSREIASWIENEVFEEVEWEGQDTISTRWIVTEKITSEGSKTKARLVARGFEEEIHKNTDTESPTCCKEMLRIALAIIQRNGWVCHTIDIKSAFLQGNPITREVYLFPPPEFFNGKIWKLKKTVYGLNDAARVWYDTVKSELIKYGMRMAKYDPATFVFNKNGNIEGIVCIHVDDFCWGGTVYFENNIIGKIKDTFLVGSVENKNFKYVGLYMKQSSKGIEIDQESYIKSLNEVEVSHKKAKLRNNILNDEEVHKFRSVIGQLNWIGTQTRPDISYDVCSLSTMLNKCTVGDMIDANKVVKRVKTDQVRIVIPTLKNGLNLICYSDASFANLNDYGSQGGFIIFLADNEGNRCPVLWKSKKIRRIVKSTLAAETMALLEVAESAYYVRKIIEDIGIIEEIPIYCYVDNKSLVEALRSLKKVDDKYLRINIACLKDMLERSDINKVEWVDTKSQLANCLTKKGASSKMLIEAITGNL